MLTPLLRPAAVIAAGALALGGLLAAPLAAQAAAPGDLRITEWEYDGPEFVEFTNVGADPVDLNGWSFSDSGTPAGQVPFLGLDPSASPIVAPGESFVLAEDPAATFRQEWNLPASIKVFGGNTTNLGKSDTINLWSGTTLVDSIAYPDGPPKTKGVSAHPSSSIVTLPTPVSNWVLSTAGDVEGSWTATNGAIGSPGVSRFGNANQWIQLNEIETDGSPDWAELVNLSPQPVWLAGFTLTGRENAFSVNLSGSIAAGAAFQATASALKFKKSDKASLFRPDGQLLDSYEWGDFHLDTYGRVPNGTGAFVQLPSPGTPGALNPTDGTPGGGTPGGGTPSCSTEAPSGDGPAPAGGIAWPGSATWSIADEQCEFATSQSGQDVSGLDIDPSDPGVLWAVKNKNHVFKLVKDGSGHWIPATDDGWGVGSNGYAGKDILFPNTPSGLPDSEGITTGPDGMLYATTERDNANKNVSLDSVLQLDPASTDTTLTASKQWDLTSDFVPSVIAASGDDANLGFEGITWVPDSYLTAHGFVDESTGEAYDPADYPAHGTGLYFLALEKNGHLYAYALGSDGTHHRIADIASGMNTIADTQWDADNQRLWAIADNSAGGSTTLLKVGSDGAFAVDKVYDRPTGLDDLNLEGFAIAPDSTCVNGEKEVIRSDDGNNGTATDPEHSLWSGTIDCDLGLVDGSAPSITLSTSSAPVGGHVTITVDGLTPGTEYEAVLHSQPVVLGTATAGAGGRVSLTATIPAVAAGAHTITIAASTAPGTVLGTIGFTVTAAASTAALAETGVTPGPWVAVAAVLLLLGAALVVARRRVRA